MARNRIARILFVHLDMSEDDLSMVSLHDNHIIQDISGRSQHSCKTRARDHILTISPPLAVKACSRKVASSSDSVERPC